MTLLELVSVLFIVGMLGAMAVTRYGTNVIGDLGADGFAQRVAFDCLMARRGAIATGDIHLLRFTLSGGDVTQYAVYRRIGGVDTRIDDFHIVPAGVAVTTGGVTDVMFSYTGEANASYTITCAAPDRACTVTVYQVTGKAFVQ